MSLRSFTADDVDHLYDLNGDPDVMWFLTGGEPTPRDEVRDRIIPFFLGFYRNYAGLGFWAAETKPGGDFLGWFHLRPPTAATWISATGCGRRPGTRAMQPRAPWP